MAKKKHPYDATSVWKSAVHKRRGCLKCFTEQIISFMNRRRCSRSGGSAVDPCDLEMIPCTNTEDSVDMHEEKCRRETGIYNSSCRR